MTEAEIQFKEFKGDNFSIKMVGGKMDGQLSTGSIASGSTLLTIDSAGPLFTEGSLDGSIITDVGKPITVMGAGAAGANLAASIASYVSPTQVDLTIAASTTVTDVDTEWGSDDTAAWNAGIAVAKSIGIAMMLPPGRMVVTGLLSIVDAIGVTVNGRGANSIISPWGGWADNVNLIDLSGSQDIELYRFQIDGRFISKPSLQLSAIYGDGTAGNPSYGNIRLRRLILSNWQNLGLAVGATSGNTISDAVIEDCIIRNFGASFFVNAIDTGSTGTKVRYTIKHNRVLWNPSLITGSGNGIFCGHGVNSDFKVLDNYCQDCPGNSIQVFSRPYATEVTSFIGATVTGNTSVGSGLSGLAFYGVVGLTERNNTVRNPGTYGSSDEDKSAILITHGITGVSTEYSPNDLDVGGGDILSDDRGAGAKMVHGIYDSHALGRGGSGHVDTPICSGHSGEDFKASPNDAPNWTITTRSSGGRLAFGKTGPIDRMDNVGNARFALPVNDNVLISAMIESAGLSPFLYGFGLNVRYDPTADLFQSGFDGVTNAFGVLAFSHADGAIRLITKASTGPGQQTLTRAAFGALLQLIITAKANGYRIDGHLGLGTDPVAAEDLITNAIRALTTLKLDYALVNQPVFTDGAKGLVSGKINPLNANHFDASGIAANSFVTGTGGGALSSLAPGVTRSSSFTTGVNVVTGTISYQAGGTSATFVTSVTTNQEAAGFTKGVRTT